MRSTLSFVLLLTVLLTACTNGTTPTTGSLQTRSIPPAGKIVVVEYSDFNCPACKSTYPLVREIERMDDVYFELRHFPLPIPGHETSPQAASAYECGAEQGLAPEFAAALFENQSEAGFSDAFLTSLPAKYGFDKRPGFDAKKYAACFTNGTYKDKVSADKASAQKADVTGTPAFVVDGTLMIGARDLMSTIEAARTKLTQPVATAPATK